MNIERINFKADGYVSCESCFYTSGDRLSERVNYSFKKGINKLTGDIDEGVWAVSYYLSMFRYRPKDFTIWNKSSEALTLKNAEITVNDTVMSLKDFSEYSCYMDQKLYPLFSTKKTIRQLVTKGIKKNKLDCSADEIKEMFCLDEQRFERPVFCVGNERFRSMAAIGYAFGKQVYCFPWHSKFRTDYYQGHLKFLLPKLEELGMTVIFPTGRLDTYYNCFITKV